MSSPFQQPDDRYFQQLEEKLNRIPDWQSPSFRTQDGYWEDLEVRILQKTVSASKTKVRPLWIRWVSAAAASIVLVGGLWSNWATSDELTDVTNEDILVYLEEHQSSALPVEEIAPLWEPTPALPLNGITEKDVEAYDEVYGI